MRGRPAAPVIKAARGALGSGGMGAVSVAVEEPLQAAAWHDDPPAETQRRKIPPGDELVGVRSRDPKRRSSLGHGEDEAVVVTHAVTSKDGGAVHHPHDGEAPPGEAG